MIITRTPFRVTLGGGGTDLPAYYEEHGGFILAAAIDKYMQIDANKPTVEDSIMLHYSQYEAVQCVDEVQHKVAREVLRLVGIENNIEISSMADIPAGTGLGSSSCYAIGLLNALHTLCRHDFSAAQLAEEDFRIEHDILGRSIGKQDPYMAAFGGITVLDIKKDGTVRVQSARISEDVIHELNNNLLLYFTGHLRRADDILDEQSAGVKDGRSTIVDSMRFIEDLGRGILEDLELGNVDEVGHKFDIHWRYKKKISSRMTNLEFDRLYLLARESGALGGKISGAGGGGFFAFYVPGGDQRRFREAMRGQGLREMRYRFKFEGSKVWMNS